MDSQACPVCKKTDLQVYLEGDAEALDASMIGSSRKTLSAGRILRCRKCEFGFRQSRFDERSLAELYRKMDPQVYEAELSGRSKTALRHLNIVRRYVREGRILDVGCASGCFLSLAANEGFESTGVEPSDTLSCRAKAALGARGTVWACILEQAPVSAGSFDAITLWDVLEHVPDPLAMLQRCRTLLRPGGHMFLNVPDLDSIQARLLKNRWPLLLPEHLNYFNRPSLRLCGQKADLKLIRFGRRRAFFSMEYVFYRLSQHSIPGTRLLHRLAQSPVGRLLIPVSLGETYAVWQRTTA